MKDASGFDVGPAPKPVTGMLSEMGRSNYNVECPYCREWVRVYVWSFRGCGKACSCGALLFMSGSRSPETRKAMLKRDAAIRAERRRKCAALPSEAGKEGA